MNKEVLARIGCFLAAFLLMWAFVSAMWVRGASSHSPPEFCSQCDQLARGQRVEIKREAPILWDDVSQTCERDYRVVGTAWRCWGCSWKDKLPMTAADKRVSDAVLIEHGWWWSE